MIVFEKYEFLDERELLVLKKRHHEGLSFGKIGKLIGKTGEMAKHVFVEAKKKIILFNNPRSQDMKIKDTPLSTRIKRAFDHNKIEKMIDLDGMSKKELMQIRNLGVVSVNEIQYFMFSLGLILSD